MGREAKRVVESWRKEERRRVENYRPAMTTGENAEVIGGRDKRERRGQAAPFIVGQAYLTVAR